MDVREAPVNDAVVQRRCAKRGRCTGMSRQTSFSPGQWTMPTIASLLLLGRVSSLLLGDTSDLLCTVLPLLAQLSAGLLDLLGETDLVKGEWGERRCEHMWESFVDGG